MKNLCMLFFLTVSLIACSQEKKEELNKQNTIETSKIANNQTYEMEIKGMTCEIGCARTIESKLSKVKGISYSKVDFESKKGTFTIDTNIINEQKVIEKIAGIAGGGLYSVVNSKKIEKNRK